MIIINLLGPPGAGKSTTAAGLFHAMKLKGFQVELVTEYAKDLVYEERHNLFEHQDYIFAKQHRRISRLKGKVDFVITDSPLIQSLQYVDDSYPQTFKPFIREVNNLYENSTFFINRVKPYNPNGRYQTEEESNKVGLGIKDMLNDNLIPFMSVNGDDKAVDTILTILGEQYDLKNFIK